MALGVAACATDGWNYRTVTHNAGPDEYFTRHLSYQGEKIPGSMREVLTPTGVFSQALYYRQLPDTTRANLRMLRKELEPGSKLETFRNQFAFHYDATEITKLMASTTQDDMLETILSTGVSNKNTLYAFAHQLVFAAQCHQYAPVNTGAICTVMQSFYHRF